MILTTDEEREVWMRTPWEDGKTLQRAARPRAQDRDARANCMSVTSLRPAII